MANNKAVLGVAGRRVERRRKELRARREKLGSYEKLAQELGVNVSYVHGFLKHGRVPMSKRVRELMGIGRINKNSKGGKVYRERSEKAKAKGWSGLSEALTAMDNGVWELPEK